MKKAEQEKDTGLKCKTCNAVFPSKTKLFDHLKQSGHAAHKWINKLFIYYFLLFGF